MSEHTPDETQIVAGYSHVAYMDSRGMCSEADAAREARRGIAKLKADAWDECARSAGDMASPLMDQNPYRDDPPSLKRAPQPEPWQALADVMIEADLSAALSIPELAEALHQSGVRVTGGNEA